MRSGTIVGWKMAVVNIVLFAALLAYGTAELVESKRCEESNDDICKVTAVRIDPCPNGKTCFFRQVSNASISFDFTPNFSSSNLKTVVYWVTGVEHMTLQIPFVSGLIFDNACEYTTCPTVPGQAQTLNYNLHVGTRLPRGTYPLKWKVWNTDNESEMCCFKVTIKLKQAKKNKK